LVAGSMESYILGTDYNMMFQLEKYSHPICYQEAFPP
jgi:hypothetical protein